MSADVCSQACGCRPGRRRGLPGGRPGAACGRAASLVPAPLVSAHTTLAGEGVTFIFEICVCVWI